MGETNINMDGTQTNDPNTCPQCKRQQLAESYTVCGLIWAFCCFPCGLLCCLTMKDKNAEGVATEMEFCFDRRNHQHTTSSIKLYRIFVFNCYIKYFLIENRV